MRSQRLDSIVPAQVMDHLIRRECARADRNGHVFSLVLFRVTGGNRRRRSMAAHRLARVMLKRVRLTDDVGWLGEQHLAALLPDTLPEGARAFADGVCDIIARRDLRPLAVVYAYPHDRGTGALAPQIGRLAAGGKTGIAAFDAVHPVNGHAIPHANGNGHSNVNGNGHAHVNGNGNGHSHVNGNGNGHAHVNGNGHSHANGNGNGHFRITGNSHPATAASLHSDSGSTALLTAEIESPAKAKAATSAPAVKPVLHHWHTPVIGVEELLAFPIPRWKRAIDIIASLLLMVLFSPILAIAALAIKLTSPGPVVFTQRRSGLGGKPFLIYKLRTMIVGAEKQQQELRKLNEQDGPAFKLTRDPRVTRVGSFLRKTSIDELPQLWNILIGDMSLVGPRPLPIAEQEGCEQWQRHRLNVTPGITCIWQVKGRSQVSFAEWVRMDVEYIRRRTIFHDLSIIFSTIPAVLLRNGAR
jgi:lipopolysaccharide/colanic/teichoic acid biosynthesis glycosyltransferase